MLGLAFVVEGYSFSKHPSIQTPKLQPCAVTTKPQTFTECPDWACGLGPRVRGGRLFLLRTSLTPKLRTSTFSRKLGQNIRIGLAVLGLAFVFEGCSFSVVIVFVAIKLGNRSLTHTSIAAERQDWAGGAGPRVRGGGLLLLGGARRVPSRGQEGGAHPQVLPHSRYSPSLLFSSLLSSLELSDT